MRNHIFRGRNSFDRRRRIGRLAWQPLLEKRRDPWRPIAQSFDLLVLDVYGVTANPVVATHTAIEHLGISNAAEVWLCVSQQWRLLEILNLHFHHANPRSLSGLIVRKWIVRKRPCVPFAPESIHEGVDELDLRTAVKFG